MKASTKRVLSLLGTAVLFIGSLVVYALLLSPYYTEINTLRGELAARLGAFKEQNTIIAGVKGAVAQYGGSGQLAEEIDATLPINADNASLVTQIKDIAEGQARMTIQSLSVQKGGLRKIAKGNESVIGAVEVNARLVGSYDAFKIFLTAIRQNIRLMDISELRIEPFAKNSGNILVFNVGITTYYQGE